MHCLDVGLSLSVSFHKAVLHGKVVIVGSLHTKVSVVTIMRSGTVMQICVGIVRVLTDVGKGVIAMAEVLISTPLAARLGVSSSVRVVLALVLVVGNSTTVRSIHFVNSFSLVGVEEVVPEF